VKVKFSLPVHRPRTTATSPLMSWTRNGAPGPGGSTCPGVCCCTRAYKDPSSSSTTSKVGVPVPVNPVHRTVSADSHSAVPSTPNTSSDLLPLQMSNVHVMFFTENSPQHPAAWGCNVRMSVSAGGARNTSVGCCPRCIAPSRA